jgi:hypothetical protein
MEACATIIPGYDLTHLYPYPAPPSEDNLSHLEKLTADDPDAIKRQDIAELEAIMEAAYHRCERERDEALAKLSVSEARCNQLTGELAATVKNRDDWRARAERECSELAASEREVAELRAELAKSKRRREHTEQWYAERCERLWHWAHADKEHRGECFSIIANGVANPFEIPTYAQLLNTAKHEAEANAARAEQLATDLGVSERQRFELLAGAQLYAAVAVAAREALKWFDKDDDMRGSDYVRALLARTLLNLDQRQSEPARERAILVGSKWRDGRAQELLVTDLQSTFDRENPIRLWRPGYAHYIDEAGLRAEYTHVSDPPAVAEGAEGKADA